MSDIFVIGLCGESVFMEVDHITNPAETVIANNIAQELGGKGFNQAIVAAKMGTSVSFMSAVGDDSGALKCEEFLEKNNVKPYLIRKKGAHTAYACILTDKNGENCVTEYLDAILTTEDVDSVEKEISNAKYLILQHEVPIEVNRRACEIADKYGVKIILNPAPAREEDIKIRNSVYIVIPNEIEVAAIDASKYQNCIKTLGSKGCLINEKTAISPINVKAVDTTGAGDTFCGALTAFLLKGNSIEKAAEYANIASGISVTRKYVLNAFPTLTEVINYKLNK